MAAARWSLPTDKSGPHVFCVCDGRPVVRGEYYREVARLVDAPEPRFVAPDENSPAAARAAADKRIANRRMVGELGVVLSFPSHQEGLESILADSRAS